MRSLRRQILDSSLLLVLVMLLIMGAAIANFFRLGNSIDHILKDNYASVIAAQNMKEALERQDSAATFYLAGQTDKAQKQYRANVPVFQKWASIEANNITESGEQQMSDDIQQQFPEYQRSIEKLLYSKSPMTPIEARMYYFATLEPQFLRLKQRAQDVLDINQRAIVRADNAAKREAAIASWLGIIVTSIALIIALSLTQRTLYAVLTPLRAFVRQANEIGAGHLDQKIELNHTDEIGALADAFNAMTEKLRQARRTEEQRLHRAERMSDEALENLFDPVIVTDAEGLIVTQNRAAEALFGKKAQRNRVQEPQIAAEIERALRGEQPVASEEEKSLVRLPVGSVEHSYRLRANPMHDDDNTLLGAVIVLEDVTHLYELDRLKTEFIGVASHELRTPVTSLLLSVQLLEEGAVGELTSDQKMIIAAQHEDLERLERMMRDLLDITRLESGDRTPQLENVPVRFLIHAAISSVEAQAAAKQISLIENIAPKTPSIRIDRAMMTRALVNLLNNAIRHTPEHGTITITCEVNDNQLQISVADTGVGIPSAYLTQIFDRFVQVPNATRGGTGLGLSIAQTIVKAHGGEITVNSELDKGSCFTIILPLNMEEERKERLNGTNSLDR